MYEPTCFSLFKMLRIVDVHSAPPEVENPYPFPLDPFQKWAFQAINNGENVLVTAKTGSGKTLVGEYQIRVSLAKKKRVFYTTPIKSLSNQKFHDLKAMGLSVGIMTGDIKFAPHADVVVMTTEILNNLLFKKDTANETFVQLSLLDVDAIIFDEVHYINNPERGKVWEQCLMLLPREIHLVLLSATIADAPKFASWLADVKHVPLHLISTQYRVIPLVHMAGHEVVMDDKDIFHRDAYNRWLYARESAIKKHKEHQRRVAVREAGDPSVKRETRQHSFVHMMNEEIKTMPLPALFFVFSRAKCEEYASAVTSDLLDSSETASVQHILDFHLHKYPDIQKSEQYFHLKSLLEKGIAFHHSGLVPVLKEIVEILFGRGFLKVLFATETFSVGINMPTKTVVFTSYTKHDGLTRRMLRSDEYIQMAGRAGRRGKDTQGFVLYLPDGEPSTCQDVMLMMTGGHQRVKSRMEFGYPFLIQTFYSHELDWKDVLHKSYWFQQMQETKTMVRRDLDALIQQSTSLSVTPDILDQFAKKKEIEDRIKNTTNAARRQAQQELERWKNLHVGPKWITAQKNLIEWQTIQDKIVSLEGDLFEFDDIYRTIEDRITRLTAAGYLGGAVGALAANVHEGHPILTPFAFHNKIFHGLDRSNLVGCLSLFGANEETDEIRLSDCTCLSMDAHRAIETLQQTAPTFDEYTLDYYWANVVMRWMEGEEAVVICQDYGIYLGNFVRAMLKIANIVDEWIILATMTSDLEQLELLRDIRPQIVKGVVVPDSLYLHIER